jgi:hypothetical protein
MDSWLLCAGARGPLRSMKQRNFYETLALKLIDNYFDSVGLRARTGGSVPDQLTPTSGIGPHATPTSKRRSDKDGREQAFRAQRNCDTCGVRTTKVCSSSRVGVKVQVRDVERNLRSYFRVIFIRVDPCSRFRARGGHSVGTRLPLSPLAGERPKPLFAASLAANHKAPGTPDRHARGKRCRPCQATHVAYDIHIILRLTPVSGRSKDSCSSCHTPASSAKPLPAAESMRTDDSLYVNSGVVERGHGKTEPGGGHRQSTARALPRGRLPALGSSGWTRVPFTQRRLEAAVYLSKEKQAGMGENPEREEKPPKLHLTRRYPLSPNRAENHDLLRSDTEDRPSPSTLEPSRRAASRRSGNPGRLPQAAHA